jgi:hypothetical protein
MKRAVQKLGALCLALCFAAGLAPRASARQGGDYSSAAAQYVKGHEEQLQQTTDPHKRLFMLSILAPAAFVAGDAEKARAYAKELLALGEQLKSQPGFGPSNYGQATHVGNLVLGRLALAAGDVSEAKERLLAAGRVPGSPTLNSYGPDMLLAKELIEKGERQAAVEYFDLCAKFWARHEEKLSQWKETVAQGGMPDFGFNLGYVFGRWRVAR